MYDITIINTLKVAINSIRCYILILKKATLILIKIKII